MDISATLPIAPADFSLDRQALFRQALANATGAALDRVAVIRIAAAAAAAAAATRRGTAPGVQVDSTIAAASPAAAAATVASFDGAALSQQLLRRGLPAATVLSVGVRQDAAAGGAGSSLPVGLIVGVSVAAGCALLLALGATWAYLAKDASSPEERQLRQAAALLRRLLGIEPRQGFVQGAERVPWGFRGAEVVHLLRGQVEAGARLLLYRDFDANQFDAFCLCLEGCRAERPAPAAPAASFRRNRTAAEDERAPYDRLCDLVLALATPLVRPDVCGRAPGEEKVGADLRRVWEMGRRRSSAAAAGGRAEGDGEDSDCPLPIERRFRYFMNNVRKARVWQDDPTLFARLQVSLPSTRCCRRRHLPPA